MAWKYTVHVCLHKCTCTCMCARKMTIQECTDRFNSIHVHVHTHKRQHGSMFKCMYKCMCVCEYESTLACVYVHIEIIMFAHACMCI